MKKRFAIICNNERRKFFFESVLDVDHAGWYFAIKVNINVFIVLISHKQNLEEDDYIAPGTPITPDIQRVCVFVDSYCSPLN